METNSKNILWNINDILHFDGIYINPSSILSVLYLAYCRKKGWDVLFLNDNIRVYSEDKDLLNILLYNNCIDVLDTHYASYQKIWGLLQNANFESDEEYCHFIDYMISGYGKAAGRSFGELEIPEDIAFLIKCLLCVIESYDVFIPYSGLGTLALDDNLDDFECLETNIINTLISQIRMDAHGLPILNQHIGDPNINDFSSFEHETLVAIPPFGMRVPTELGKKEAIDINILNKFLNGNFQHAVIILPKRICYDSSMSEMRKNLIENDILETVIELPSGIFNNTSISTVAIVLSKSKTVKDQFVFVDGNAYFSRDKEKHLDNYNMINNLSLFLDGKKYDKSTLVGTCAEDIRKNNYSLVPSLLIQEKEDIKPGEMRVSLEEIMRPASKLEVEPEQGYILSPSDFSDSPSSLFKEYVLSETTYNKRYSPYAGKMLIMTISKGKFQYLVYDSDKPVFLNSNQIAFEIINDEIDIYYLAIRLMESDGFQKLQSIVDGSNVRIIRQLKQHILNFNIVIKDNPEARKVVLNQQKTDIAKQIQQEKSAELQRLGIRTASSDLAHMLGTPFNHISTSLSILSEATTSEDDRQIIANLKDNFEYIQRFIKAFGADFSSSKPRMKEVNVNSFVKSYIESWNNFGSSIFDVEIETGLSDDATFKINEDLMKVLFDTVFDNAYRHAFSKTQKDGQIVQVEISGVTLDSKDYICTSIRNNGFPFPKDFSINRFISRGEFSGENGRTGLGGNHIYSITKLHDGFLGISESKRWGAIIDILIPAEYFSEKDVESFNPYDNGDSFI